MKHVKARPLMLSFMRRVVAEAFQPRPSGIFSPPVRGFIVERCFTTFPNSKRPMDVIMASISSSLKLLHLPHWALAFSSSPLPYFSDPARSKSLKPFTWTFLPIFCTFLARHSNETYSSYRSLLWSYKCDSTLSIWQISKSHLHY